MIDRKGALCAAVAAAALFAGAARAQVACSDLNGVTLPLDNHATQVSLSAIDVPAQTISGLKLPEFCLVQLAVSSNGDPADSYTNISVGMPVAGSWNGRYMGTGNGGFAGSVNLPFAALYVSQGYAAANTDMGTAGQNSQYKCNALYCGSKEGVAKAGNGRPGGLYGKPGAIRDFGYASTHLMTLAAKQLMLAYYGRGPNTSYFHGCSTGGAQALMEAQRYPADYDTIIAGSPAYNRTHLHIAGASLYEATHAGSDAYLTRGALTLAHQGVLKACAGKDGGLSTDDYLTRPASCAFDASALQCTGAATEQPCTDPNAASCTCLTTSQTKSLNALWTGAMDTLGRVLFPGYQRGAEVPDTGNAGPFFQESLDEPPFDSLMYWAFGADWDWHTLFRRTDKPQPMLTNKIARFDQTPVAGVDATGTKDFRSVLNSTSADLSAFARRGGKLVMYAGYDDPLIPSASSIDYANAVLKRDAANWKSYLRLFLAPGMWHCSGGPGANAFGNASGTFPPNIGDPADDIVAAAVKWREQGVAPETVLATKWAGDQTGGTIVAQRPLCAYPRYAKYVGGDATQAASWRCVAGNLVLNQKFDPAYGPR